MLHQNHAAATKSLITFKSSSIGLMSLTDERHVREGSGDTKKSSPGPLRHDMQTRSCQPPNRRLARRGWWGDKRERGGGGAGEASAQQDG